MTRLPNAIGELVGISYLEAKSNEIAELPASLGNLVNCFKMDFSHNMLTVLVPELGKLEGKLNNLEISHNPVVIPPQPVLNRGTREVLKYLRENDRLIKEGKISGLGLTTDPQITTQGKIPKEKPKY